MQLTDTAGRLSFTTPSADGSAPLQTFVFSSREDVAGEVKLAVLGGKRVEHAGVRVELKGVVELAADKTPHEFVALAKELAPPGASQGMAALRFSFSRAELPHDSYVGVNARVRYFLRAVVASKGGFGAGGALVKELDFCCADGDGAAGAARRRRCCAGSGNSTSTSSSSSSSGGGNRGRRRRLRRIYRARRADLA